MNGVAAMDGVRKEKRARLTTISVIHAKAKKKRERESERRMKNAATGPKRAKGREQKGNW